ncbi:MAG: hypothetical protein RMK51_13015 [Meiothermus sp.]|nr:hypothetical protein [Meiothermus sp.]MDW8426844.1 hypothetical protein [Meiothermus sp.]
MTQSELAVLLGWRVLRFTPAQVAAGEAVLTVQRALWEVAP